MGKRSRASRSVKLVVPEDDERPLKTFRTRTMRTNAIAADKARAEQEYNANLNGMDEHTAQAITAMRGDDPMDNTQFDDEAYDIGTSLDNDEDWVDVEDGVEADDELMRELLQFSTSYRKPKDTRTWGERVRRQHEHWKDLMPSIIEAYLAWRYPSPSAQTSSPNPLASDDNVMTASVPEESRTGATVGTTTPAEATAGIADATTGISDATEGEADAGGGGADTTAGKVDMTTGVPPGTATGKADTTAGTTAGTTVGVTAGTTVGATAGMTTGVATDATTSVAMDATMGAATGTMTGVATDTTTSMTTDATTSAATDATTGVVTDATTGAATNATTTASLPADASVCEPEDIEIAVVDIYDLLRTKTIPAPAERSVAEALVSAGYLCSTPIKPRLAISLQTLELLRCVRLFKPSFSIEAFAKLVCHYYCLPYRRTYRNALSDAFDIYLAILRAIDKRVLGALGRDTPDWRVLNACPACCYKLRDEPERPFSRMYCMDGNNSLKRMRPLGGRKIGDARVFEESDYFLPQSFADRFANEVRSRPQQNSGAGMASSDMMDIDDPPPLAPVPVGATSAEAQHTVGAASMLEGVFPDPPGLDEEPEQEQSEGDPTDGAGGVDSLCTKNWKAAQSDEKKRSWDIFEETGIFASACRHGLILWLVDMVRSGELARYPLAIVAKVLDVLGERMIGGYDVGCSFLSTVQHSSLGPRFAELHSRLCVNSFHGYSHDYSCQVNFHPTFIKGMGIEDLETMERIFSSSNQLASVIRYATAYRRRVLIDLFFQQWDIEKYLNLGKMLFDNYHQALDIIKELEIVVTEGMKSLGVTAADLERFAAEERAYLGLLGKETPEDLHEIAYVETLQEYRSVSVQLARTNRRFFAIDTTTGTATAEISFMPPQSGPTDYDKETARTRKLETATNKILTDRKYLENRKRELTLQVADFEVLLGVSTTWQPSDPAYIRVAKYIATRKYQQALSNLQRLIVQRLFELHKLNLAQTGYRMRRNIAKNMQTRSRAIWNAIATYNTAAAALDPPRPKVDWETVSHYQFLEEFDLLNETRADVRDKPWAQPAVRELARVSHRLAGARDELVQVHIEARRVHTSIRDEDLHLGLLLSRLMRQRDPIHGAVLDYATRRRAANAHVLMWLKKLYQLPQFGGDPTPGTRISSPEVACIDHTDVGVESIPQPLTEASEDEERQTEMHVGDDDEDEDVQDQLTMLSEFIGNLTV